MHGNGFPGSLPLPKILTILTITAVVFLALQAAPGPRAAQAATATLYPISDGTYTSWTNGYAAVDESASFTCDNATANSVISASAGARESFNLDLNGIPDGSVIESIEVTVRHRGTFNQGTGGTYQTFVRIGTTNVAPGSTKTATTDSGSCQGPFNDTYDVADFPKTSSTSIEIGVLKGNSTSVNVGAISAVITYTAPDDNPDGFDACEADVVLIMDSSDSVSDSQMDDMKAALKSFSQSFLGDTSSSLAVVEFDNDATTHQGLTNDYPLVATAIDQASTTSAIGGGTEWTNWQAALLEAQAVLDAGDAGKDKVAILISDGDPTQSNAGSPTTTQPNSHYLPALQKANTMKGLGAYIITLGVSPAGADSVARLNGISSPSDTYTAASYDLLDEQLANVFADAGECFGELTLVKEIVNDDGGTRAPSDWTLTATSDEHTYSSVDPLDEIIEDDVAAYFFRVAPGTYQVSESGPGGYTASDWTCDELPQIGGDEGEPQGDPSVFTIAAGGRVVCDIVNNDSPGLICVDGDFVAAGQNRLATNDCDPVRLCVDGQSMTVTEFKYRQLQADEAIDVSRGSCDPVEEPPPSTQVPPTPASTPAAPTQEVLGIVATPTPEAVVESITPPNTGDAGLKRDSSTTFYAAILTP